MRVNRLLEITTLLLQRKTIPAREFAERFNVSIRTICLGQIVKKLIGIDLMGRKETQRKLLLMDILSVLALIRKTQPDERIERYFQAALTGGILDSKAKRVVAGM